MQWQNEIQEVKQRSSVDKEVLNMNVGGEAYFSLTRELLTQVKGSHLQKMFSGNHQLKIIDDQVFIDRDAKYFKQMISYLRNERQVYPSFENPQDEIWFSKELKFWGIPNENFESKSLVSRLPQDLVTLLENEPKGVKEIPLAKWRELGPLDLASIIMQASEDNPVSFEHSFGKNDRNYSFDIQG